MQVTEGGPTPPSSVLLPLAHLQKVSLDEPDHVPRLDRQRVWVPGCRLVTGLQTGIERPRAGT